MLVPGPEDRARRPPRCRNVVVLRRDHAADDHDDVVARPASRSCVDQLRARASCARRPGSTRRRRARRSRSRRAPLPRASGTAGRRRRRSRGRRTRWRSPWRRGRGRPGRAWRRGCAAGGLRASANSSTSSRIRCELLVALVRAAVHAGDASGSSARWRPNTFSSASEISPTVARARVASIESSSRLPSPAAPSRERVERGLARAPSSRSACTRREPRELLLAHARCCRRRGCRSSASSASRYLLTPTIDLLAAVDARLAARRGLLDAQLRHARLDRLGHAAERLDLLDQLPRLVGEALR